jgi:hypothetical protein
MQTLEDFLKQMEEAQEPLEVIEHDKEIKGGDSGLTLTIEEAMLKSGGHKQGSVVTIDIIGA